jgi:hypothetical protein
MIKGARGGQGKHEAIGRGGSWEMAAELTDEQKKAVTHVLGARCSSPEKMDTEKCLMCVH